jgi:hypothetical protein
MVIRQTTTGGIITEYIFENENAIELYYLITKKLGIKMTPKGFNNSVYMSEAFLMTCLTEIYAIKENRCPCMLNTSSCVS